MNLKFFKFFAVIFLLLIVLASGCIEKKQATPLQPNPSGSDNSNNSPPADSGNNAPLQDNGGNGSQGNSDSTPVVPSVSGLVSPLQCNDNFIALKVASVFGSEYSVAKAPVQMGKTSVTTDCYFKKNNVSIISYNFIEALDNEQALAVLEDEKKQYEGQLFSYETFDSPIGSKGYLVSQPLSDGEIVRLVFVDDSNAKAVVIMKSVAGTPRETVERFAQLLEELI